MPEIHLLGIRHHGPGSCRNTLRALEQIAPDLILLEGPQEAEALLRFAAEDGMAPPVALLGYQPDAPQNAIFYPFADFSPEWQTIRYALQHGATLRFFDLPLAHTLAFMQGAPQAQAQEGESDSEAEKETEANATEHTADRPGDPFDLLAQAAGYADGESWWNMNVEQRRDSEGIFEAVREAVSALRETLPEYTTARDRVREAWMRRMIRNAEKESFARIAIVCGAWHVPALESMPKVKEDNELLKGLAKVKVECTWIPWTHDRLTLRSGYGAGIASPGWYDYLWNHPTDDGTQWVSHIAALLRDERMDISVAHVIETVRLANTTAALRGLPTPTLQEYNEAVTTVMGFGDPILLKLIGEHLVVGDRLGKVPDGVPKVPLLTDLERIQKKLRVPFTAEIKELTLDLRKELDQERSLLFHRLALLGIDWASPFAVQGAGTFKEGWKLYHRPEQIVDIIERAIWGNTLEEAAQKYTADGMAKLKRLPELSELLYRVLPADLPSLVEAMTQQLETLSAASTDIEDMLEALPNLIHIVRYGNVRQQDFSSVGHMLKGMMARILAGGILACSHIDEEAAGHLLDLLSRAHYAVGTLEDRELSDTWYEFLHRVRDSSHTHPLLSGYTTRLLYDRGDASHQDIERMLRFYSSAGNPPIDTAHWFEGFLRGTGTLLLLNDDLWRPVHQWVCGLHDAQFYELLPIIRRTFSEFTPAERRKLGEKAKGYSTQGSKKSVSQSTEYNATDAARVLPLLQHLLGIG